MSSETSTDTGTFRRWHLFALVGLLASTVGVVVVRPHDPVVLVLLVAAIGAASWVGFTLYRTLWPLAMPVFEDRTEVIAGRTRAALDREKTLVLRAIKELEFDRAMNKVSPEDFQDMSGRLRVRAIALLKQLDVSTTGYREQIESELAERLRVSNILPTSPMCSTCDTENESDAKFCKACGSALELST